MKYLLWLVVIAVIWWVWSKRQVADRRPASPMAPSREAEKMVRCAHCGVYLPESDGLVAEGQVYCSEAHRKLGVSAGSQ